MGSLPAFDRPKKSIRWAREALDEIERDVADFFSVKVRPPFSQPTAPYVKVVEREPDTGNEIHKLRITLPLPDSWERRTFEALQNVRNAFDQAVYAACCSLSKVPKKGNLHFPWSTQPSDLEGKLKNGPIPVDLWDAIRRQEPYFAGNGYTGGDDTIRELAKLANGKHTVGLSVASAASVLQPPSARTKLPWLEASLGHWSVVKNEIFLVKVPPGSTVYDNYVVRVHVGFDEPPALRNKSAVGGIKELANRAERFTKDIETVCAKILGK